MSAASKLLLKAADLIEEKGLNKNGDFFGPQGECCILGALYLVGGSKSYPLRRRAREEVYRLLLQDHGWVSVPRWNDDPATTQDDVTALLRRAAKAAR